MSANLSDIAALFPSRRIRGVCLPPLLAVYEPSRCGDDVFSYIKRLPRGAGMVYRGYDTTDRMRRIIYAAEAAAVFGVPFLPALASGDDIRTLSCLAALRLPVFGAHVKGRADASLIKTVHLYYPRAIITGGVRDAEVCRKAQGAGVDVCLLSPLFPTKTHPGAPSLGCNAFSAMVCHTPPVPVYALGGVTTFEKARVAVESGAAGVASIGLFT